MNKHDKKLIYQARHCNSDYFKVWELETQAQSDECKEILKNIGSTYYHNDEYDCGIL
jgi:hypothetical protein